MTKEELALTAREMRLSAAMRLHADSDAIVRSLRDFVLAAAGALGEISYDEALEGIARTVREEVTKRQIDRLC